MRRGIRCLKKKLWQKILIEYVDFIGNGLLVSNQIWSSTTFLILIFGIRIVQENP